MLFEILSEIYISIENVKNFVASFCFGCGDFLVNSVVIWNLKFYAQFSFLVCSISIYLSKYNFLLRENFNFFLFSHRRWFMKNNFLTFVITLKLVFKTKLDFFHEMFNQYRNFQSTLDFVFTFFTFFYALTLGMFGEMKNISR
jgi:hypothetical protein